MLKRVVRKTRAVLFGRTRRKPAPERQQIIEAWESLKGPPSVLFFTTHKCASVFVDRLLAAITSNSAYQVRNYASAMWNLGDRIDFGSAYEHFLQNAYDRLYNTRGYIYAPQRRPLDFPGRENFNHIFFLRDPRDVLVSAYYSFGYSHALPKGEREQRLARQQRNEIQGAGVDNYAQRQATEWLLPLYTRYRQLCDGSRSYLYVTYDQFKDDTIGFIQTIAGYLEVAVPHDQLAAIAVAASPVQSRKDITRHKRSGKSRQYLEELRPETVQYLNRVFADVLRYWNFQLN